MLSLLVAVALAGPTGQPVPQLPPPDRGQPLPAPTPVPQPPVAVSLADFSRGFTPLPGKHQVCFLHPCSKCPGNHCGAFATIT